MLSKELLKCSLRKYLILCAYHPKTKITHCVNMCTLDFVVRSTWLCHVFSKDKRKHGKLFAAYLNIKYVFRFMYNIHCTYMSSLNQLPEMLKQ